jgi:hypothetical protein
VYVDGEQVTDLLNGEHVVFYLSPGVHRIAVSTQFDPIVEIRFVVTADNRYTNRASAPSTRIIALNCTGSRNSVITRIPRRTCSARLGCPRRAGSK